MKLRKRWFLIAAAGIAAVVPVAMAQVTDVDDFGKMLARMEAAKPQVMQRQQDLLNARYVST